MDYKKRSNITVLIFGLLIILIFFKFNIEFSVPILFGNFWLKSFNEINSNKKRYLVIDVITIMWLVYLSVVDITALVSLIIIVGATVKDIIDCKKGNRNISTKAKKKKKQEYYFSLIFFIVLAIINVIYFFQNEGMLLRGLNIAIIIISIIILIGGIKNKKYFD